MDGGKVDLHLHTFFSDGHYSPAEVVELAKAQSLDTISITDHDTIDALPEAGRCCKQAGISLVPGIEFTTYVDEREVHILSYYFDTSDEELLHLINFCKQERYHRAERMIKKLNQCGVALSMPEVEEVAGPAPITRPHIAAVLQRKGVVQSFNQAFDQYIGNASPCYERKIFIDPTSIFDAVRHARGLSFIAHPANMPESVIVKLIGYGMDGIETVHPSHSPAQSNNWNSIAEAYFLLTCGGSDFHGGRKQDEENIGKYYIAKSRLVQMKQRLPAPAGEI
jgi:predicted metal-dependent phosphoesterase TrpH